MSVLTPMEQAINDNYEFQDCEYCTHCVTVNDDMDKCCTLKNRIVYAVCERFEHFEGKTQP